ncbi:hypothetical protein H2203_003402 [Taxawa tesnikishii (nom. ined.)]|nr:hypothetical protein H2203_003402 [Dothideales sp. JES 119]
MVAFSSCYASATLVALAIAVPVLPGNGGSNNDLSDQSWRGRGYSGATRVSNPESLDWYSSDYNQGAQPSQTLQYQCYKGDVSKYPSIAQWLSFNELWNINSPHITARNNGNMQYTQNIHDSIMKISQESNVDARVILAMIMQESTGQVDVQCTGPMPNCGLMQASYNSHSFEFVNAAASILQMIQEGVMGTTSGGPTGQGGPGYAQFFDDTVPWVKNPYPNNPYAAARLYNSGVIADSGSLDDVKLGVQSYANDVANRLLGWDGNGAGFGAC